VLINVTKVLLNYQTLQRIISFIEKQSIKDSILI